MGPDLMQPGRAGLSESALVVCAVVQKCRRVWSAWPSSARLAFSQELRIQVFHGLGQRRGPRPDVWLHTR